MSMTDHGIRDEWSTRKDGERGEQGNQVWEVSRRSTLPHRGCLTGTVRSRRFRKDRRAGHASAASVFDRCYTGITLVPPSFRHFIPFLFARCAAPLYFFRLRLCFYPIVRSTGDARFLFSKNSHN